MKSHSKTPKQVLHESAYTLAAERHYLTLSSVVPFL